MKNIFFAVVFTLIASTGFSQVAKGTGIFYFNGPPTIPVNECYDGEVGIDTSSGYWYEFSRDLSSWIKAGFRVQLYDTCARPVYTPVDKQSEVVLNSCDSLYRWRAGAWYHLNPGSAVTGWTIAADDVDTELITNQTVTFSGAGITTTDYDPGTDVLLITSTEVDGSITNELQTLANTSDATSHTVTLSNSGGSIQLVEGANVTLTTSGTGSDGIVTIAASSGGGTDLSFTGASSPVTLNSSTGTDVTFTEGGIVTITATSSNLTISATEVDGSITNEGILGVGAGGATSSTITSNTSGANDITVNVAGILSISETTSSNGGSITITGTEVDGSVTNELQTLANTSDATSHTVTLSNSGGSIQLVEGSNITLTTSGTGSDGIVTIAAASAPGTDLSFTGASSPVTLNSSTGTDVTFTQGGIVTITATSSNITISATEVDGSVTNEAWTIDADDADTEVISNQTVKFQGAGITTTDYNPATDVLLITSTEVDGSVSNELQTLANTSNATSHTVTLSNSGGSVQLVEGSNVTLTTTGTGSDGIVTIASTEVDGSITNEGILGVGAGGATSSTLTTNTSTGNPVTVNVAGILSISETTSSNGGSITITGTEVDGSVTNELQTLANTSNATSHTVTLSNSGGSVQLVEGSNITLTTTGTGSDGIVTIAAASAPGTDLSFTGASSPVTLNSSTGTDVTFTQGGIVTITGTSSNLTISATEVDGSVTNELQTLANTSNATSHTVTLSNSGGSVQLVEGSNITLTTTGTGSDGIVTIASTAGGITAADNGLTLSGSTVKLGGPLTQAGTSIEIGTNEVFRWYGEGKWSVSSWTGFGIDPRNSKAGISGLEGSPTLNSTPTIDAALELNTNNSSGTIQSNSLAFGGYATDADGFWIQSRSGPVPNFEYPLSLQPRGGQLSVGRLTSLSSLVTFTGTGLTGSTAAGSVLLLENSEGNGKTSLIMGSGSNNVTGELAMFHATDAFRITNRNGTNGTSSIRVALGGETSDVASFQKSAATTLVKFGVGTTAPGSTLQSAGSFGTGYLETVGAPTFDETKRTVIYTASVNISWTLPTAASCNCQGREYILHHSGSAGTITLSQSVSKGNTGNFNTLAAGEWAYIIYGASSIRGYKLTSN